MPDLARDLVGVLEILVRRSRRTLFRLRIQQYGWIEPLRSSRAANGQRRGVRLRRGQVLVHVAILVGREQPELLCTAMALVMVDLLRSSLAANGQRCLDEHAHAEGVDVIAILAPVGGERYPAGVPSRMVPRMLRSSLAVGQRAPDVLDRVAEVVAILAGRGRPALRRVGAFQPLDEQVVAILARRVRRALRGRPRAAPALPACCDPRSQCAASAAGCRRARRWRCRSCDPRSPCAASAADSPGSGSGISASCDPRWPRTASAASFRPFEDAATMMLRSSLAADGQRCLVDYLKLDRKQWLRSSPATATSAADTWSSLVLDLVMLRSSLAADGQRCTAASGTGRP